MLKQLLSILLFFPVFVSYSQTNEFFGDLKGLFETTVQADIDKAVLEIKNAEEKEKEAVILYESGATSKSVSILEKSSKNFEIHYRKIFTLFDEKLSSLQKDVDENRKKYTADLLSDARNLFSMSISKRLVADNDKDDKKAYTEYISAHEDEVKAINALCHAFAVITGRIEENPVSDINAETYEIEPVNTVTDNFVSRSFTVKSADLPSNFSFDNQTYQINTEGNQTGNTHHSGNSDKNNSVNKNGNLNKHENNSGSSLGNEFRLQIGTSILPANETQIKNLNKTNLAVQTFKSKIYYKYTVGNFSSFQEAKNFKNAYGLSNTYIVEYNNGKEIKFYYGDTQ